MNEWQSIGLVGLVFLIFLAINRKKKDDTSPVPADLMDPQAWEIGPADYPGGNPSQGVPLHPLAHPEGWCIDIPQPSAEVGHVHYVTVRTGSLAGKTGIELHGRLEMEPGVLLVPTKFKPLVPGMITVYLRRKGDTYTKGYELFRWFCTTTTIVQPRPGDFVIHAPFNARWTPVEGDLNSLNTPEAFAAALANPDSIGFVLGGGDGYGHGVYATGPARLVITSVKVE